MLILPPLPNWDTIHPLLVHFPIALLLVAPLFIAAATILREPSRAFPFMLAALLLMALGTLSAFAAVSSGKAAGEQAEVMPYARQVLDLHRELSETTAFAFAALTLIFACILFMPRWLKTEPTPATSTWLPLFFLLFYASGTLILANAAHQGGRLVHEFGIRAKTGAAPFYSGKTAKPTAPAPPGSHTW
ncbi:MAG TPA: DUF2231 domain-containing protein [Bryobacteraceae bacterium]|nr:DUF2231 domain-containing protein [Bryobacteraceae bacterium]